MDLSLAYFSQLPLYFLVLQLAPVVQSCTLTFLQIFSILSLASVSFLVIIVLDVTFPRKLSSASCSYLSPAWPLPYNVVTIGYLSILPISWDQCLGLYLASVWHSMWQTDGGHYYLWDDQSSKCKLSPSVYLILDLFKFYKFWKPQICRNSPIG